MTTVQSGETSGASEPREGSGDHGAPASERVGGPGGAKPPGKKMPLRVWPGVVAVVLQWLARFGIKAVVPGFKGFAWSAQGGILGAIAVILWWLFFSRAAWVERLGAIVLMIAAMGATWGLRHESVGPVWRSEEHTSELQSPCNLVGRL